MSLLYHAGCKKDLTTVYMHAVFRFYYKGKKTEIQPLVVVFAHCLRYTTR